MKRGSTLILRTAVVLIGLIVLALCAGIFFLIVDGKQNYRTPVWLGLYASAVPFFIALGQAWKLLGYIDSDKAFSRKSVRALRNIRNCALAISGLFALGMPYILYVAQKDDAPGIAAIGFIFIGASFVIATAAALFQRLLKNALDIKSENDLTV